MNKELQNIHIIFENTDYAIVTDEYIKRFQIKGISETITGNHGTKDFIVNKIKIADKIVLILDYDLMVKKPIYTEIEPNKMLLERLQEYNDITQLILNYSDNTEDTIHVKWQNDDYTHDSNSLQLNYVPRYYEDIKVFRIEIG